MSEQFKINNLRKSSIPLLGTTFIFGPSHLQDLPPKGAFEFLSINGKKRQRIFKHGLNFKGKFGEKERRIYKRKKQVLVSFLYLLELKFPFDPVSPSRRVCRWVVRSVYLTIFQCFLKGREVSLPCSYRSTFFCIS